MYSPSSSAAQQTTDYDASLNKVNPPFGAYSKAGLVSRPKLLNVDKVKAEPSSAGFSDLGRDGRAEDVYYKLGLPLNIEASDSLIAELISTRLTDEPTQKQDWIDRLRSIAHHRSSDYLKGYLAHVCSATAALQPERKDDVQNEHTASGGRWQQQVRDVEQDVQWIVKKSEQMGTSVKSNTSEHADWCVHDADSIIFDGVRFVRASENTTQEEQHDPVVMITKNGDTTTATEERAESYHYSEDLNVFPTQVAKEPNQASCNTCCTHNCEESKCDVGAVPEKPLPYSHFGTKTIQVTVVDHSLDPKPYRVFNVHRDIMCELLKCWGSQEDIENSFTFKDVNAYAFHQLLSWLYADANGSQISSERLWVQGLDHVFTPRLYALVSRFQQDSLRQTVLEIFSRSRSFGEFLRASKEVYRIGAADSAFQAMFKEQVRSWLSKSLAYQEECSCNSSEWGCCWHADTKSILKQATDLPAFLHDVYEVLLDRECAGIKAEIIATTKMAQEYDEEPPAASKPPSSPTWGIQKLHHHHHRRMATATILRRTTTTRICAEVRRQLQLPRWKDCSCVRL